MALRHWSDETFYKIRINKAGVVLMILYRPGCYSVRIGLMEWIHEQIEPSGICDHCLSEPCRCQQEMIGETV